MYAAVLELHFRETGSTEASCDLLREEQFTCVDLLFIALALAPKRFKDEKSVKQTLLKLSDVLQPLAGISRPPGRPKEVGKKFEAAEEALKRISEHPTREKAIKADIELEYGVSRDALKKEVAEVRAQRKLRPQLLTDMAEELGAVTPPSLLRECECLTEAEFNELVTEWLMSVRKLA